MFATGMLLVDTSPWYARPEWWLVIVAIPTLPLIWYQVRVTARSAKAAQDSAEALVNSERAWVIAELSPRADQVSDGRFHRRVRNSWASLSPEEIGAGRHYDHALKLTNMGKTPAHIIRFQINYACLPGKLQNLPEHPRGEPGETFEFDHMVSAGEGVEVVEPRVNTKEHMADSWNEIHNGEKTAIVYGWVDYRHVFSRGTDPDCRTKLYYEYRPSLRRLSKIGQYSGEQQQQGG